VYLEDNGQLKPDAGNLAAVLFRIRHQDPGAFQRIVATIHQMNPQFDNFVLEPSVSDTKTVLLNWQEVGRDVLFGPHQISDGTLRAMALVTLLLQPSSSLPEVIVVDEPELGLHPYVVRVIAGLFRKVSHHCQAIISTQSVQLLEQFQPDEVIVVDRPEEATDFKRLSEEELAAWLEDYSLGELWEKNVFGGGPH
jgi:predicted ATPase